MPLCPLRMLQLAPKDLAQEVLRWKGVHFPMYMKGHLLIAGGIAEQPARWLEAMLFLEDLQRQQDHKLEEILNTRTDG